MGPPFFTVGHSNRPLRDFIELLREASIALVVDVRKLPGSRANPQFNGDALAEALASCGISYEHMAALGGRRPSTPGVSPEVNAFWSNQSFHNYADYALTPPFHAAFQRLREMGRERACAIMCSEAVWWRCHRRIVADHLIASGETVLHLMGPARLEVAHLTEGAIVHLAGTVTYPASAPGAPGAPG